MQIALSMRKLNSRHRPERRLGLGHRGLDPVSVDRENRRLVFLAKPPGHAEQPGRPLVPAQARLHDREILQRLPDRPALAHEFRVIVFQAQRLGALLDADSQARAAWRKLERTRSTSLRTQG